jgi:cobyrinic acid a,c-diamide synthase
MGSLSAFVVAGTHSGVGKTTVSLGIMAALRRRGMKVQPFKIGPDFIDPGLHRKVCGVPSYNLDGWMLSQNYNRQSFRKHLCHKNVAVVEGMMGLYDGRSGGTEEGSTAEMAKLLGLPVILIIDASAMARSAAAMALGYRLFDRKSNVMGVIFNRIAGTGASELSQRRNDVITSARMFRRNTDSKRHHHSRTTPWLECRRGRLSP